MDREHDQINVVPLVDVMLVLLVIVLTTATFITTGHIPVELASAKDPGSRQDVPIVITVTGAGALFVNDRPVAEGGLGDALMPYPRQSMVVLRADRATILERFVEVVDGVRAMGFQHVSLAVTRS